MDPLGCPTCGAAADTSIDGLCPACLLRGLFTGEETLGGTATDEGAVDAMATVAGDSFGPYKIVRVLGRGGMGAVFLAQQSGALEREVALKVLKSDFDTRRLAAGFAREKQTLARLRHPGIVHVFDAGVSACLRPYFVMEIVEGLPITRHSQEFDLTVAERISLFLQVCEAVDHAHRNGVIHRDLKPSNVLVTTGQGTGDKPLGCAKVIDFGIAKLVGAAHAGTMPTLLTREARLAGTPGYMSPEQAGLISTEVGPQSDVYSLGAILYEMLTGKPALELPDTIATNPVAVLAAIREQEPALLSERVAGNGELSRELKGDLEAIVSKALDKVPTRRYESAAALAADLTRYLEGRPVLARPAGFLYRISKWHGRNRVASITGSIAAVCILASAFVITFSWEHGRTVPTHSALQSVQQSPRYTSNKEAYRIYLEGRFYWAKRKPEFVQKAIARYNQVLQLDPNYALAYTGLADSYAITASGLPGPERWSKGKAAAERALALDDSLAEAQTSLAFILYKFEWNWLEAERHFHRAIQLQPNYELAHHWFGEMLVLSGRMDEGLAQLRQAQSLDPLSLPARNDFARALYRARRYDDAIQESQRILDLDPSFSNAFATLTYAYEQKHEYAQAVKADLQVLHLAGRAEDDIQALQRTFYSSGWQAYWAGEFALFQRKSPTAVTSYVLAETYLRMGDREQALHLLEESFRERGDAPLLIGVEPLFDPLRSDRRFIDLMRRVGLPQGTVAFSIPMRYEFNLP